MRSKGSEIFKACDGTSTEWAGKLGVSVPHVSNLRNGKSSASEEMRAKIFSLGGPAPALWDTMLPEGEAKAPGRAARTPQEPATADSVRRRADRMQNMLDVQLDALENDSAMALEVRGRALASAAGIVADLGKLTGASELNERRLLMAPAMGRIRGHVITALLPFPDALEAVSAVFERLSAND